MLFLIIRNLALGLPKIKKLLKLQKKKKKKNCCPLVRN